MAGVRCERWREELSARLDGEDDPARRQAVDAHLARCPGCRGWLREAATLTGVVRAEAPAPGRDFAESVLAATAPQRRRRARLEFVLRLAVAAVGVAQLVLGTAQVLAARSGYTGAFAADRYTVTPTHMWHESAAWNIAVGVGFVWIGFRRSRPAGLVPMLTVFVITLAVLSGYDLIGGRVQPERLLGHGFLLVGYLLVLLASRLYTSPTAPPAPGRSMGGTARSAVCGAEHAPPAGPPLRLMRGSGDAEGRGTA